MRTTAEHTLQNKIQVAHRLTVLGYLLYLLGALFGITALIGVIVNHIKLPQTRDTYAHSHLIWQIASFWILFIGIALVVVLWPTSYSKALACACLLWWMTSALTGIWYLVKKTPVPFVKALFTQKRDEHASDR